MTKLYELLAVEPDLRGKATAIINEVRGLFDAGQAHFLGQFRKYQLIVEGEDTYPEEHTELATTVEAELARVFEQVGAWIDVSVGKEIANTEARDTILIDGTPLLGELPATALLRIWKGSWQNYAGFMKPSPRFLPVKNGISMSKRVSMFLTRLLPTE